jgi:hypothetical protein
VRLLKYLFFVNMIFMM